MSAGSIHSGTLRQRTAVLAARAQRYERPARAALLVLVIALLARDLARTGLGALLANLPSSPWFYLIFVVNYLALPAYEAVIYRYLWRAGPEVIPSLLRKRVLNETVIEYAGETAFCLWAGRHLGIKADRAVRDVRDVNLLSTIAGSAVTLGMIGFVAAGHGALLPAGAAALLHGAALLTGGLVLVLVAGLVALRRRFAALSAGQSAVVLLIHLARLATYMVLQAWQWHVAVPALRWGTWMTFLALQMAVQRLPLLPAKELFFTDLAIRLGGDLSVRPAAVAGAFVAATGLGLLVHAAMYALSLLPGWRPDPAAAEGAR